MPKEPADDRPVYQSIAAQRAALVQIYKYAQRHKLTREN